MTASPSKTGKDLLGAMLSAWMQWAPGDSRGSTEYATLGALRRAVSSAGMGITAKKSSVTAEVNAQVSTELRDSESAEESGPKKPRLEYD